MPGRPIPDEAVLQATGYTHPDMAKRRAVLRQTLDAFARAQPAERYHRLAAANLERWTKERHAAQHGPVVQVIAGDWGEVTATLTRTHGACFAVLNMANAYVPGGAYVEGAPAQEENMFRRTDCHFHVSDEEYDASRDRYEPHMTRLLSGYDGRVYLDAAQPRVCIRGAEDRSRDDLGYEWLADDDVFPFFELRAAAQDLRGGAAFDEADARRRIAAQLDTLIDNDLRHAVLSAFGCGAFQNPAQRVAELYREQIDVRAGEFSTIAFAIYAPGYGPNNFPPFAEALGRE
jgi:hypothetical protein